MKGVCSSISFLCGKRTKKKWKRRRSGRGEGAARPSAGVRLHIWRVVSPCSHAARWGLSDGNDVTETAAAAGELGCVVRVRDGWMLGARRHDRGGRAEHSYRWVGAWGAAIAAGEALSCGAGSCPIPRGSRSILASRSIATSPTQRAAAAWSSAAPCQSALPLLHCYLAPHP